MAPRSDRNYSDAARKRGSAPACGASCGRYDEAAGFFVWGSCTNMGMDQYLYIPFLGDEHPFTSYFDVHQGYQGFDPLPYEYN